MKKFIIIASMILLICATTAFAENLAYSLELSYKDGVIAKKDIILIESQEEIKTVVGGEYDAKLYSFEDNLLFETSFNFELERSDEANPDWFDSEGNQVVVNQDEKQIKQEITKTIFLPYFKDGKEIRIYKYDELELTVDVSNLASCNNNGKCDNGETFAVCPKECLCGNKVCNNGESYSSCSQDCPKATTKAKTSWLSSLIEFIKNLFT